jgi:hypothetical protein
MAPLPADSTPRYKVFYINAGATHVMDIRSHASPATFGSQVDALLTALGSFLLATTVLEVQFAADGSNVFNAVTSGIEGNTYGTGAGATLNESTYINFIGRSSDGRRTRLAVFGVSDVGSDCRFAPTENALVDAAIAVLQDAGNSFVTIGDLKPLWKSYANAGFNAHWQKAMRV